MIQIEINKNFKFFSFSALCALITQSFMTSLVQTLKLIQFFLLFFSVNIFFFILANCCFALKHLSPLLSNFFFFIIFTYFLYLFKFYLLIFNLFQFFFFLLFFPNNTLHLSPSFQPLPLTYAYQLSALSFVGANKSNSKVFFFCCQTSPTIQFVVVTREVTLSKFHHWHSLVKLLFLCL